VVGGFIVAEARCIMRRVAEIVRNGRNGRICCYGNLAGLDEPLAASQPQPLHPQDPPLMLNVPDLYTVSIACIQHPAHLVIQPPCYAVTFGNNSPPHDPSVANLVFHESSRSQCVVHYLVLKCNPLLKEGQVNW